MTLRLYDTATRSVRDFEPLQPGTASVYLCGATVQAPPHIGHIRSGVNFDILRRWLTYRGYEVIFIRNITDIDDKILTKSVEAGVSWWAWAASNERAFTTAYDLLGCLPPTYEPRATGHVTDMIDLMARLIESGHAYAAEGDVFFDVASWPEYGALSGQRLDEMQPAGDTAAEARKRDPRDFALWKGHKADEPASAAWPTPWGSGRPGWHLECSAMATRYLGPIFDIHGGGLDLVFPHHENELAQSRAAGDGFARYWLHNGMLNLSGQKMSKSVGNTLVVTELAQRWRPVELRYYLGAAHYRSAMDFSPDALDEAAAAYRRIENFVERASERFGDEPPTQPAGIAGFARAMDDDLGVPQALAEIHTAVREGNAALANGRPEDAERSYNQVLAMSEVLGINPVAWQTEGSSDLTAVVDGLVRVALEARAAARARKDYAAADAVREQLAAAGVIVEDTPDGPRWTLKG